MNAKNIAMTVSIVGGLLFLAGSGCSDKDKGAQMQAAMLRSRLDAKEKELACKVNALSTNCKDGDTGCTDTRAKALAECDKIAAEAEKRFGGIDNSTTTVTNTGTNTSTSTNTGT